MKRRRGTSLFEVLSVVTISTIVLTSLGFLLNRMLDHYHATGRSVDLQRTVARISRMFRDDVHHAASMVVDESTLTLAGATERIEYQWTGHRLSRTRQVGDQIHRDRFILPACCIGQFLSHDQLVATQQFVRLSVQVRDPSLRQSDPIPGTTTPRTIVIEASLGRDHAYKTLVSDSSPGAKL